MELPFHTLSEFQTWVRTQSRPCLFGFYSSWARPIPALVDLERELRPRAHVLHVDQESHPDVVKHLRVPQVPAVVFLRHGQVEHTWTTVDGPALRHALMRASLL